MSVSKIAGIKPSDIGLKVLRGSGRPILPATRDRILVIPGRSGAWDFGTDLGPREFPLDCAFITRSPAELQAHAETLAKLLVDGYGIPRTVDLVLSLQPERVYHVRYSGSLPIDRLVGMGRFTLPLVAFDPFGYLDEPSLDSEIILDSDTRLDGEEYSLYAVNDSRSGVVPNIGSIISRPTIEVTGSFTTLTITANGKTFAFNEAMAGETLMINGESLTAKIGTTNKLTAVSGDFIEFLPGDNLVEVSGTGLNIDIKFVVKPKFI